jgi:hypothetical protein
MITRGVSILNLKSFPIYDKSVNLVNAVFILVEEVNFVAKSIHYKEVTILINRDPKVLMNLLVSILRT